MGSIKGRKKHGEVWHIFKIIQSLEKAPNTQMFVCERSLLANHTLQVYLKKLKKLGFVKVIDPKVVVHYDGKFNARAKLWEATKAGIMFKDIIGKYVKLKG